MEELIKKLKDLIYQQLLRYAQNRGYKLNPDKEIREMLIETLAKNELKYGFRYCPCRKVTRDLEKDRQKICPCFWHQQEIEKEGHCHCSLFVK